MGMGTNIFVDSQMPLEDFVRELESLLAIRFQLASDSWGEWYEFRNTHTALWVATHEYDNDRDMNFEDYRYEIEVRAINAQTEEERKKWRDDVAHHVFKKLKKTKSYPLMMTENLEVKLAAYSPEQYG